MRGRRYLGMTLAAGLLSAAVIGLTAGTADAAVTGVIPVDEASALNSNAVKTAVATCPPGKRVLGGGGLIGGAPFTVAAHVIITELRPIHSGGGDAYQVSAIEDQGGEPGNWQVIARAICADPLPGLQIVTANRTLPSSESFQLGAVQCPVGKSLVGTGGRVDGGDGQVHFITKIRQDSPRADFTAFEDADGFDGNWTMTTFAVCANASPDFQVVSATFLPPVLETPPVLSGFVACPSGMQPIDAAGETFNGRHIMLVVPGATEVNVVAVAATPVSGSVTAYAICARV